MAAWRDDFGPLDEREEWLFEQVVVSSVRLDHCRLLEAALLDDLTLRAALSWDEDRGLAAEETAAGLSKRPALVCRRLRQTAQGCEWLLNRWRVLGAIIEEGGSWTEAQAALAADLLGIDPAFRDVPVVGPGDEAALVAEQVASLQAYKDQVLDGLDAEERERAEAGLPVGSCRALERLRRYEAACFRRLQWASARLPKPSRNPVAAEAVSVAPAPVSAPPPPPPPTPAPPPVPSLRIEMEPDPVLALMRDGQATRAMVAELKAVGRELKARAASSGAAPRPASPAPVGAAAGSPTPPHPDRAGRIVDGDTRR
jgi:hypothetical protein